MGDSMPFRVRQNAILILAICLLCSACANNNSWQVDKTYTTFERMLVQTQNAENITKNNQSIQFERKEKSYLYQGVKHKNTAFDIENNAVFILTKNDVGSGFFIAPGIIITNKHVVKSNKRVIVFSKNLETPQLAVVQALSMGKNQDYAILKMQKDNYGPRGLAICAKTEIGENVSTWGFPLSILERDPKFKMLKAGDPNAMPELIYSEGMINSIKQSPIVRILHTAEIFHGSSGSPLTNSDYCVVGINTYLHTDKKTKQRTSIALGAEDIVKFLKTNGVEPINYQP